jgi:uncharacterized protein
MARPVKPRTVCCAPDVVYFKPRGVPLVDLEEVVLGLDETEALRLADLEGLSQLEVGQRMHVSRATVGRILESAHRKVADAIVRGKALRIEGGVVHPPLVVDEKRRRQHAARGRQCSRRSKKASRS